MPPDSSSFGKWQRHADAKAAAARAAEKKAARKRAAEERAALNAEKREAKAARAKERKAAVAAEALRQSAKAESLVKRAVAAAKNALLVVAPRIALLRAGDMPVAWQNISAPTATGMRRATCSLCKRQTLDFADDDLLRTAAGANWHLHCAGGGIMICPACAGKECPHTRSAALKIFVAGIIPFREIVKSEPREIVKERLRLLSNIQ